MFSRYAEFTTIETVKRQPLVSVVTIFLNEERFIEESIESVLAQTIDNWELLLVDDGSADSSTTIAQQYAELYPQKIRYLQHEGHQNCGKSVSRNLGIKSALGEFIAFLDADDVFLPEKLQRQTAALMSHPSAAMVYGPTLYWYGWTGVPKDRARDELARLGVPPGQLFNPPRLLTLFLRHGPTVPATCGLLVRRQVAMDVGGFDETIHYMYEDQIFLAKICSRFPVFVESGCWDKYRQHPRSTSEIARKTGIYNPWGLSPSQRDFLYWLNSYLIKEKISERQLWKALNKKLWPYRHPILFRLKRIVRRLLGM